MAVVVGDRECVELLLQREVDVNAVDCYYGSALQAAARVGNVELVQLLLGVSADVNLLGGRHGTALRAAVLGAHEEVVCILIKHGADVNLRFQEEDKRHENSQSVLHLALEAGNVAIVKSLIAAGAAVNVVLLNHPRVLTAACRSGDVTMVQLLLDRGADVNASGKHRPSYESIQDEDASALYMASGRPRKSVARPFARVLLEHGAETEKEVKTSGTPLQVAARAGHISLVRLLIEAGANVDHCNYRCTALSIASGNGHLNVVQELLSAGASIADPPRVPNALAVACQRHRGSIVELLLEELSGTDKEESACADALSAASSSHDDETFRLLLEHGVSGSPSTLRQGCAAGLEGSVRIMLESGVDVNADDGEGGHALHIAACHQRPRIVQLLVDHGADVHFQSAKYGTPLLAALEGCTAPGLRSWARSEATRPLTQALPFPAPVLGYKDFFDCERVVRRLVDGADVYTEPRSFVNVVHLASFMGSEVIVRLLLDRGADVNSTSGYFETALLAALEGDHPALVELLLCRGINVNDSSSKHGTALHYACLRRSKATVRMLLNYGADVNASGGQHGSPLAAAACRDDMAFEYKKEKRAIVELLLQCGDKARKRARFENFKVSREPR